MLSSKIIQDNDNILTTSYMILDAELLGFFQHRFVLLRGYKHNNKQIRELRPQLFNDPNQTLDYWKLAHRYFVIDLLNNKCLIHCEYVKKGSTGHIRDLKPFAPYILNETEDIRKFIFIVAKHENDNSINIHNTTIKNIYQYKNKWFLIIYNYMNTEKFIINTKAFVDFGKYFSRKHTIDRILHVLDTDNEHE